MSARQCETKCTDVVHEWCGGGMKNLNHVGDMLIMMNMLILLFGFCQHCIDNNLAREYVFIVIFLACVRALMAFLTTCRSDCELNQKAWSTRKNNDIWFMISGHTLITLVTTGFIVNSKFPDFLKFMSVIISVMVCFFQTATREHYTQDIVITAALVLLAMNSFIRCDR